MYRTGHIGVSLAVFSPVGFLLVAAGRPGVAVVSAAVMVSLAMLPDVDHRLPVVSHRGVTHTLVFAVAVGAAFGALGTAVGGGAAYGGPVAATTLGLFGFGLGFLTVFAHLVGDALTPMGVMFLWPLSRRRYSLSVARADNTLANYACLLVGLVLAGVSLWAAT